MVCEANRKQTSLKASLTSPFAGSMVARATFQLLPRRAAATQGAARLPATGHEQRDVHPGYVHPLGDGGGSLYLTSNFGLKSGFKRCLNLLKNSDCRILAGVTR